MTRNEPIVKNIEIGWCEEINCVHHKHWKCGKGTAKVELPFEDADEFIDCLDKEWKNEVNK